MLPALIAGTFDVENYGDCLFPVVAAHILGKHGIDVVSVSPTATSTRWKDSATPRSVQSLFSEDFAFSGSLIGGGNIIHNRRDALKTYVDAGVGPTAYSSLSMGVTLASMLNNRPVAWNAPGVPSRFNEMEQAGLITELVNAAGYVAVRDEASRDNLGSAVRARVSIVPDTAVELSKVWTPALLEPFFRSLVERSGVSPSGGFVAIHVKERALQQEVKTLAGMIDRLSSNTGLIPILVALAPCHGDDATARSLSQKLKSPHILLDDASSLKEIAAAIAFSDIYAGSSLHGFITSFSYGRPGLIVGQPPLPKFAGFLAHVGRQADLVPSWEVAFQRVSQKPSPYVSGLPQNVSVALEEHWQRVTAMLRSDVAPTAALRLLRFFMRDGIEAGGLDWALEAQLKAYDPTAVRRDMMLRRLKRAVRKLPLARAIMKMRS